MNYQYLKGNKSKYRKIGLKKSVFASVSRKDFAGLQNTEPAPWLDQPNAKDVMVQQKEFSSFEPEVKRQLENWIDKGYIVLKNWVNEEKIESINQSLKHKVADGILHYDYTNSRIMNAYKAIPEVKEIAKDEKTLKILRFLMGKQVTPFQTINFLHGSKAKAHSDFIHMTTEPLGYLCAIWVALEDIHPDSGPVHYYPGSHKLPYLFNEDFETGNSRYMVGDDYYENYTETVEKMVEEKGMQKVDFIAKKGDVLIWHANLLHGGSEVKNPELTRKSLVVHYFCENAICYHEITQRPAIVKSF